MRAQAPRAWICCLLKQLRLKPSRPWTPISGASEASTVSGAGVPAQVFDLRRSHRDARAVGQHHGLTLTGFGYRFPGPSWSPASRVRPHQPLETP